MARLPRAFEAFRNAKRALDAGATVREIHHVILLAITTSGLPTAVAAFTWVEDVLAGTTRRTGR